jgi:hypothetical protein
MVLSPKCAKVRGLAGEPANPYVLAHREQLFEGRRFQFVATRDPRPGSTALAGFRSCFHPSEFALHGHVPLVTSGTVPLAELVPSNPVCVNVSDVLRDALGDLGCGHDGSELACDGMDFRASQAFDLLKSQ